MSSYFYPDDGSVRTYANVAAFPVTAANGELAIALSTYSLYIFETGTGWVLLSSPGGGTPPGGLTTSVQFNNGGVFGGDASNFFYNNTTHALSTRLISVTPGASNVGGIVVLAPTAYAGPVIEVKSNGSQVAYISDLGNTLFAQMSSSAVSTDAIGPKSGPSISIQGDLLSNSDDTHLIGDASHRFTGAYITTVTSSNLNSANCSLTDHLELSVQGTSYIKWQANSHALRWKVDNTAGSNQDWFWPGSAPGSTSLFQIDASGNITFVAAPSTPGLGTVMGVSADATSITFQNTGSIQPGASNTYDVGYSGYPYANGWFTTTYTDNVYFPSMLLTLGNNASNDRLKIVAGDCGNSPGSPGSPAKWLEIRDAGGSTAYIPLYT